MSISEVIQAVLIATLVMVTFYYARKTADIANKTAELAQKAGEQTSEMQEQRKLSIKPWVFPGLNVNGGLDADVFLRNYGNGSALMLRAFIVQGQASTIIDAWKQYIDLKRSEVRKDFNFAGLSTSSTDASCSCTHALRNEGEGWTNFLVHYRDMYDGEYLSGFEVQIHTDQSDRQLKVAEIKPVDVVYRKRRMVS